MKPESYITVSSGRAQHAPAHSDDQLIASLHDTLLSHLPTAGHALHGAAHHHFEQAGKQLRARMAMMAASAFGTDKQAAIHWALAVEVLHNASLVHDDICDGDMVRRGRASVWAKFGRNIALALGDWLIGLSFELAAEAGRLSATTGLPALLARHMKTTTTGQAMEFDQHGYPDWKRYLQISSGKTAPLFIAPVEGIALIAGRTDLLGPLTGFFTAAGTCYQIANDIQNVLGTDGAAHPNSDLLRRAPNAVIVQFISLLPADKANAFHDWLSSGNTDGAEGWQTQMLASEAPARTAEQLLSILSDADNSAAALPADCLAVVGPIQNQIQHVCRQMAARCDNPQSA